MKNVLFNVEAESAFHISSGKRRWLITKELLHYSCRKGDQAIVFARSDFSGNPSGVITSIANIEDVCLGKSGTLWEQNKELGNPSFLTQEEFDGQFPRGLDICVIKLNHVRPIILPMGHLTSPKREGEFRICLDIDIEALVTLPDKLKGA